MKIPGVAPLLAWAMVSCTAGAPKRSATLTTSPASNASRPRIDALAESHSETRRDTIIDRIQGFDVADPYRWLEDGNDPQVKAWSERQDAATRAYFAGLPDHAVLASRIRELLAVGDVEAPAKFGQHLFFMRRAPGHESSALFVRERPDGPERAVVDPNTWDTTKHEALMGYWPSPNGNLLAYTVSKDATDECAIRVIETASGSLVTTIDHARYYAASWNADGTGMYYTYFPDATHPTDAFVHSVVRLRLLHSGAADETLTPEAGDPTAILSLSPSDDGKWLILTNELGFGRSTIRYRKARGHDDWHVLVDGPKALTTAFIAGGSFFILTNDGAPNQRLFRAPIASPNRSNWVELVKERQDAVLEDVGMAGHRLVLRWRHPEGSEIELRDFEGRNPRKLDIPALGLATTPRAGLNDKEAFFRFDSFVQAPEILKLDLGTGAVTVSERARTAVDLNRFMTETVPFTSKDGTRSFMFLVHRKDARLNIDAPVLLTGYGAHGISADPSYRPTLPAFLERGGIQAEAVLRGGGEYGEQWHEAGTGLTKQRTFDDLIAAAEELIRLGWASPERLGVFGSSSGGLAALAAATQRPELFRYAIVEASLSDMVRYPRTGLGARWISEFGDPSKPNELASLLRFSPYHNVHDNLLYPATLFFQPEEDDRVDPMHSRKMVAELQAAHVNGPVLLDIERNMAHNALDSQSLVVQVKADEFEFIFDQCHHPPHAHGDPRLGAAEAIAPRAAPTPAP